MLAVLLLPGFALAAHPLITDDAETQGQGKFQLEVNGQYDTDKQSVEDVTVKSTGGLAASILSYGLAETIDLVLGVPFFWGTVREDGMTVYDEQGISDVNVELKWRFYEKAGLNLALKPGIIVPTGNDKKGLGSGKSGYSALLIVSQEIKPVDLHLNLGYKRNENTVYVNERKDILHASLAAVAEIVKDVLAVVNIGTETNPDRTSDKDPAFALAGIIYSPVETFDLDFGLKKGLSRSEPDYSYLAGITLRF